MIRLAGCTVGCSWCDTKYAWPKGEDMDAGSIAGKWKLVREYSDHILVTGGEPGEQDLSDLTHMLSAFGAQLLLETAGTAPGWLSSVRFFDHICLSPKIGIKDPLSDCLLQADELKFVIGDVTAEHVREFLHKNKRLIKGAVVSVQPQSGKRAHTQEAVEAARKNGWRLSLQTHKLLGLP